METGPSKSLGDSIFCNPHKSCFSDRLLAQFGLPQGLFLPVRCKRIFDVLFNALRSQLLCFYLPNMDTVDTIRLLDSLSLLRGGIRKSDPCQPFALHRALSCSRRFPLLSSRLRGCPYLLSTTFYSPTVPLRHPVSLMPPLSLLVCRLDHRESVSPQGISFLSAFVLLFFYSLVSHRTSRFCDRWKLALSSHRLVGCVYYMSFRFLLLFRTSCSIVPNSAKEKTKEPTKPIDKVISGGLWDSNRNPATILRFPHPKV